MTRIVGKKIIGRGGGLKKRVVLLNIPLSNQERISNEILVRIKIWLKEFNLKPKPLSINNIKGALETFSLKIKEEGKGGNPRIFSLTTMQSDKKDIINGLAHLVDDGLVGEISDGRRKKYLFR